MNPAGGGGLSGTDELHLRDDEITDADGVLLAGVRRPPRSWRTGFGSAQQWLEVVHPDGTGTGTGSVIFRMARPSGPTVRSVWIDDPDGTRIGAVENRSRSGLRDGFDVLDGTAETIGSISGSGIRDAYTVTAADGGHIATATLYGEEWIVDLRPGTPDTWVHLIVAFLRATVEVGYRLPKI